MTADIKRSEMNDIRKINRSDLTALKKVIDSNELFPSDLLDEMTIDFSAMHTHKIFGLRRSITDYLLLLHIVPPNE